jgi:hypothetical protein
MMVGVGIGVKDEEAMLDTVHLGNGKEWENTQNGARDL